MPCRYGPHPERTAFTCALLAVLSAITCGCGRKGVRDSVTAERRDIVVYEELSGEVVAPPNKHAVIECDYRGSVSRIYSTVGQRVSKGDAILELSHPTAQAAYDAAQVHLRSAREALADAREPYTETVAELADAVASAREVEAQAEEALRMGTTAAEDDGEDPGSPTAAANDLQRRVERAREDRGEAERRLLDVKEHIEKGLAPLKQGLADAEGELAEAEDGRRMAMVRTPISGHVLAINARTGDKLEVRPGTALVEVADLSALRVHASVGREAEGRVEAGMPVTLSVATVEGQSFNGRIDRITAHPPPHTPPQVAAHHQVAIITFTNTKGLAKPGLKANVSVEVDAVMDVLAIPAAAVMRDDAGAPYALVRREGAWQKTALTLGVSNDAYVEVVSGLQEGEVVDAAPNPR